MTLLYRGIQIALVATAIVDIWGTWGMMQTGGLIKMMQHLRDKGPHFLPGTTEPLKTSYTGVRLIDYQLTVLCVFFWGVIDVQYAICVIEGSRPGNAGRWISYIAIWGAVMQNFGVANTMPIFALAYFSTSSTVDSPTIETILPKKAELVSLPISLLLGYFGPIALMNLSFISVDAQQTWLAVWQFFPLWVAILQQILPIVVTRLFEKRTPIEKVQSNVQSLRSVYAFLRYLSTFGHLFSWALSLKTMETPELFAEGVPEALHPIKVWIPASISPEFNAADIGGGAHLFLQYDRIGCSVAGLLFAYYLNSRTQANYDRGVLNHSWRILKVATTACFIGPAGAAVSLIEARDERVFSKRITSSKKTS